MKEKTVSVCLTLEESGILCHLMMEQKDFRNAVLTNRGNAIMQRWYKLYSKLSTANDVLMGKRR